MPAHSPGATSQMGPRGATEGQGLAGSVSQRGVGLCGCPYPWGEGGDVQAGTTWPSLGLPAVGL